MNNQEHKSPQIEAIESGNGSVTSINQKKIAKIVISKTIEDCDNSIETIDAVMECLHELNNLLLRNSIWKRRYMEQNKNIKI